MREDLVFYRAPSRTNELGSTCARCYLDSDIPETGTTRATNTAIPKSDAPGYLRRRESYWRIAELRHREEAMEQASEEEVKTTGKVARALKSGGWPRLLPEIALRI
jgi:hypothetical protein